MIVIEITDKIRAIKIWRLKFIAREGKRENKIYICSNQISMKHETCVSVDKFSDNDVSKCFWVET